MATKKKDNPQKAGRKTKLKPAMLRQVTQLCLLGATDTRLADFFEVCEKTISNWKIDHPEFLQAIKRGKAEADAKVADALFNRAVGYKHKATKFFQHDGKIIKAQYMEVYAPDTGACMAWLKNRDKENWRDKVDVEGTLDWGKALAEGEKRLNDMKQGLVDAVKAPPVH